MADDKAYAFRAEIRAIEEGHRVHPGPVDTYEVVAHDQPGVRYTLRRADHYPGGIVHLTCTCPSGRHRGGIPIPCKHAALVARRLERQGASVWRDGWWWDTRDPEYDPRIDDHPEDPFEGLGGDA